MELRKNQIEPVQKAIDYFKQRKPEPSIIVAPTAFGKSILIAYVAKHVEGNLLVIQPSKELLEQNYTKYINLCGLEAQAEIYSASMNRKKIAKITFATIGSIKELGRDFKEMGFNKLVIDECDRMPREADSMIGKFLRESQIAYVLGVTATPLKLQTNTDFYGEKFSKLVMLTSSSKKGNFYKRIIHISQIQEMTMLGFWSKLEYKTYNFDRSALIYNHAKSEYTEESVQQSYVNNGTHENIIKVLDENKDRKHIIVYVPSVADAIDLAGKYPNSGYVHGLQNKKEREDVLRDFKSGALRVIFNVRVLSVGFDYTKVDCIVLAISTASFPLYYQIIGRATRIDPEKENALVIDLGGNFTKFGKVEDVYFRRDNIWKMYGTDGVLLSGIAIHQIGQIKDDLSHQTSPKINNNNYTNIIMPFGKYKGLRLSEIPHDYRRWIVDFFDWGNGKNNKLKIDIINSMK